MVASAVHKDLRREWKQGREVRPDQVRPGETRLVAILVRRVV